VDSEVATTGKVYPQKSSVQVEVKFDEQKLASDHKKYLTDAETEYQKQLQLAGEKQKTYLLDIIANTKAALKEEDVIIKPAEIEPPRKASVIEGQGPRLGILNIDIDDSTLSEILAQEAKPEKPAEPQVIKAKENPIALSVSVPSAGAFVPPTFIYDPSDYVKDISINVKLPFGVPAGLTENVRKNLYSQLQLDQLTKKSPNDLIKIETLAEPIADVVVEKQFNVKEWVLSLIDPQSSLLGTLLAALIFGMMLLVSAKILAKVIGPIGPNILALKPEPEVNESDTVELEAHADEHEVEERYDAAANATAMTAEMQPLRDQLGQLMAEQPDLCAEVLRDLFYQSTGLSSFRDLLSFAGYNCLKPAMSLLPSYNLDELAAYIEDNKDEASNILMGVETAQKIYRDCISKITHASSDGEGLDVLRNKIISISDDVIRNYIKDASARHVAVMLNVLTVDRSNQIIKFVNSDVLKEATALLDSIGDAKDTISEILTGLDKPQEKEATKSTVKQTRFVMRLIKAATLDEEDNIKKLIEPGNWSLRGDQMRIKFLFADLMLIELPELKKILDSFPTKFRAEFIYVCPDAVKSSLLGAYEAGSKLRELLDDELKQLETNTAQQTAVKKKRPALIEAYMAKLRDKIKKDDELVKKAIATEAKNLGIDPPKNDTDDGAKRNAA
jgi:hypothetical protein